NDKTMTYGGTVPTFDASYSGLVNSDTNSVVTGLTCGAKDGHGTQVSSTTPAGKYAITCSGANTANYSISYQSGTLTIGQAQLTMTADNQSMTYGGSVPTFTISYGGLLNGDTGSAVNGLTCGAQDTNGNPVSSSTPAGTYIIRCSGSAVSYSISF